MADWIPNPNAGHPPHGDLREFGTSHDGPMWQYTQRRAGFVIYGYGKTADEAILDALKNTPRRDSA